MKEKRKEEKREVIRAVDKRDIHSQLADLHYTPIVTLPAIDALLISAGIVQEYETFQVLSGRRRGRKLYIRASAHLKQVDVQRFRRDDPELYFEIAALRASMNKRKQRGKKVTLYIDDELVIPVNCIVGYCFPSQLQVGVWQIDNPVLLDCFYSLPGRGGIYFTRELELEAV